MPWIFFDRRMLSRFFVEIPFQVDPPFAPRTASSLPRFSLEGWSFRRFILVHDVTRNLQTCELPNIVPELNPWTFFFSSIQELMWLFHFRVSIQPSSYALPPSVPRLWRKVILNERHCELNYWACTLFMFLDCSQQLQCLHDWGSTPAVEVWNRNEKGWNLSQFRWYDKILNLTCVHAPRVSKKSNNLRLGMMPWTGISWIVTLWIVPSLQLQ